MSSRDVTGSVVGLLSEKSLVSERTGAEAKLRSRINEGAKRRTSRVCL